MIEIKQRRQINAAIVCAIIVVIAVAGAFIYYHIDFPLVNDLDEIVLINVVDLSEKRRPLYDENGNYTGSYAKCMENIDKEAVLNCLTKYTKRAVLKQRLGNDITSFDSYDSVNYELLIYLNTEKRCDCVRIGELGVMCNMDGEYRFKINDSAALRDELYEILGLEK